MIYLHLNLILAQLKIVCVQEAEFKKRLKQEGRKEMFYLTTHSTHFIYGYMALHIW